MEDSTATWAEAAAELLLSDDDEDVTIITYWWVTKVGVQPVIQIIRAGPPTH